MMWIFASLLWLIRNLILEFIFFILVDVVAKTPLREAANDSEKRTIWLYEAGVLLGICAVIYWADHTPYLLLFLAAATGLYTQLCGRINVWEWWASVRTRWEEYQQHEESMRQVQAHLARQQSAAAAAVPQTSFAGTPGGTPGLYPVLTQSANPGVPHMMPTQGYPPNVTLLPGREVPGGPAANAGGPVFRVSHGGLIWSSMSQSNNATSGGYYTQQSAVGSGADSFGRQNPAAFVGQPVSQVHNPVPLPDKSGGDGSPSRWFGGDLKRKPLRQIDSRVLSPSLAIASSSASAIKNKFMNALGFGGPVKKPPGLRNKGQNQCFMNAVLQCLARSPYLAQCLAVDAAKELEGTVSESLFLSTLSELLDLVTAEPETLDSNVLDPTAFRHAASALNTNLVAPLGQPQSQQDSAEFLMWLLDMVHSILNKNRQALSCCADSGNGDERFSSPRLATLRFIYGDLTPAKAKELKDVCMREIELANGLENDSYAESIQRLSDLEWLLHKQFNESIVDALFIGQLVEANLCTSNNRISVTLQTFNVLPVPMAAPRPVSGLVLLEDCFTAFCHIEHLVSSVTARDHFAWDAQLLHQNKAGAATGRMATPKGQTAGRTRSSSRSASQSADSAPKSPLTRVSSAVSPIPGQPDFVNDSGFCDNVFKTSTPIRDAAGKLGPSPSDVQRRCLLRQLPECLIIQLMRFQYSVQQGRPAKLRAPVSVRLKGLDLEALVYDTVTQREDLAAPAGGSSAHSYDLYGLCLHLGADSTHHGHYISYSLAADGRWYRFDDETVTEVNMEYELTTKEVRQNAYLLFYKRAAS
ncbi:ubiquitin carboxyl-terminal hydrolase 20-like [Littorina saxatilis]|uniref:ubiquitinyl hydrolase 1 n=1 Tax=Littorina saxatilis TaxID=31220 RepID=A0AAN9BD38_9CAEN